MAMDQRGVVSPQLEAKDNSRVNFQGQAPAVGPVRARSGAPVIAVPHPASIEEAIGMIPNLSSLADKYGRQRFEDGRNVARVAMPNEGSLRSVAGVVISDLSDRSDLPADTKCGAQRQSADVFMPGLLDDSSYDMPPLGRWDALETGDYAEGHSRARADEPDEDGVVQGRILQCTGVALPGPSVQVTDEYPADAGSLSPLCPRQPLKTAAPLRGNAGFVTRDPVTGLARELTVEVYWDTGATHTSVPYNSFTRGRLFPDTPEGVTMIESKYSLLAFNGTAVQVQRRVQLLVSLVPREGNPLCFVLWAFAVPEMTVVIFGNDVMKPLQMAVDQGAIPPCVTTRLYPRHIFPLEDERKDVSKDGRIIAAYDHPCGLRILTRCERDCRVTQPVLPAWTIPSEERCKADRLVDEKEEEELKRLIALADEEAAAAGTVPARSLSAAPTLFMRPSTGSSSERSASGEHKARARSDQENGNGAPQ